MLAVLCFLFAPEVQVHCLTTKATGSHCVVLQRDKKPHILKAYDSIGYQVLPPDGVRFSGGGHWSFDSKTPVVKIELDNQQKKFWLNPQK